MIYLSSLVAAQSGGGRPMRPPSRCLNPKRGDSVTPGEDIDIDVHIIVEYGTRINSVADSVVNTVRFHVEKALGLKVNSVNVHVAGLRISDID
jgi:uncharacterized alkaline shock family protein YloU